MVSSKPFSPEPVSDFGSSSEEKLREPWGLCCFLQYFSVVRVNSCSSYACFLYPTPEYVLFSSVTSAMVPRSMSTLKQVSPSRCITQAAYHI
jgi:hypothetical protein